MFSLLRPAIVLFFTLSIITGVVYPVFIVGVGKVLFPHQASGSLVMHENKAIGSALIGQHFTALKYFWGRPSATANAPYNAMASGGSNWGPLNPELLNTVQARVMALKAANPLSQHPIPVELVTSSASGLDPHISPAAAFYQAPRVAMARGMSIEHVNEFITQHIEEQQFGLFGEPRVNVLQLNYALEQH